MNVFYNNYLNQPSIVRYNKDEIELHEKIMELCVGYNVRTIKRVLDLANITVTSCSIVTRPIGADCDSERGFFQNPDSQ